MLPVLLLESPMPVKLGVTIIMLDLRGVPPKAHKPQNGSIGDRLLIYGIPRLQDRSAQSRQI